MQKEEFQQKMLIKSIYYEMVFIWFILVARLVFFISIYDPFKKKIYLLFVFPLLKCLKIQ